MTKLTNNNNPTCDIILSSIRRNGVASIDDLLHSIYKSKDFDCELDLRKHLNYLEVSGQIIGRCARFNYYHCEVYILANSDSDTKKDSSKINRDILPKSLIENMSGQCSPTSHEKIKPSLPELEIEMSEMLQHLRRTVQHWRKWDDRKFIYNEIIDFLMSMEEDKVRLTGEGYLNCPTIRNELNK